MRRCLLVLLLLTACGSTAGPSNAAFDPPAGAVQVESGVWSLGSMLYGTDCERLKALTKGGQPYGPSPRRADGSYDAGYGYVCS